MNDLFSGIYYLGDFLFVCNILFSIIGIILNSSLVGIIFLWKQLHFPRSVVWIGIAISNIFLLGAHLTVDLSIQWGTTPFTKALCLWFAILSISAQSWNIMFALLERHICLSYPKWHTFRFLSNNLIMALQFSSFVLLFFMLGIINLQVFEEYMSHHFFSCWNFKFIGSLVLGILPFFLAVEIAVMRTKIKHYYPWDDPINSKLELEAAQTIIFTAKIYLMFLAPVFIIFVLIFAYLQIMSPEMLPGNDGDCSYIIQGLYYIGDILSCLYSSTASPLSFALLSSDFLLIFRTSA